MAAPASPSSTQPGTLAFAQKKILRTRTNQDQRADHHGLAAISVTETRRRHSSPLQGQGVSGDDHCSCDSDAFKTPASVGSATAGGHIESDGDTAKLGAPTPPRRAPVGVIGTDLLFPVTGVCR